jgi:anti-sigma factor RsiW
MKPISCQEMGELLCDYVSGELAPEQAQQVEQHARICPPCAIFLETYRFAARVGQLLRGDEMPRRSTPASRQRSSAASASS